MPEPVTVQFEEGAATLNVDCSELVTLYAAELIEMRTTFLKIASDVRINRPFSGQDGLALIESLANSLAAFVAPLLKPALREALGYVEQVVAVTDSFGEWLSDLEDIDEAEARQKKVSEEFPGQLDATKKAIDPHREALDFALQALGFAKARSWVAGVMNASTIEQVQALGRYPRTALENLFPDALAVQPGWIRRGCLRILAGPQSKDVTNDVFKVAPDCLKMIDTATKMFRRRYLQLYMRLQADFDAVNAYFFDGKAAALTSLQAAEGETHKGGEVVHFLDFGGPRLVYKPSDIELDCRIAGDNRELTYDPSRGPAAYQPKKSSQSGQAAPSLADMVNEALDLVECSFGGMSEANVVRALDQPLVSVHNFHLRTYRILPRWPGSVLTAANQMLPIGESYGYIEFLEQSQEGERFWEQWGGWMSLATAFSISDLHAENIRIWQGSPCPIDLEVALNGPMDDPAQTGMDSFGFNPLSEAVKPAVKHGFLCARKALRSHQATMDAMTFLQQCVGRLAPIATTVLTELLGTYKTETRKIFEQALAEKTEMLRAKREQSADPWQSLPADMLLVGQHALVDFDLGDVPAFYHRLIEADLRNARGEIVVLQKYPRTSYFPEPTWAVVQRQVQAMLQDVDEQQALALFDKLKWQK